MYKPDCIRLIKNTIHSEKLTSSDKLVYVFLALDDGGYDARYCFTDFYFRRLVVKDIAVRCGISEKTVSRSVERLEKEDFLYVCRAGFGEEDVVPAGYGSFVCLYEHCGGGVHDLKKDLPVFDKEFFEKWMTYSSFKNLACAAGFYYIKGSYEQCRRIARKLQDYYRKNKKSVFYRDQDEDRDGFPDCIDSALLYSQKNNNNIEKLKTSTDVLIVTSMPKDMSAMKLLWSIINDRIDNNLCTLLLFDEKNIKNIHNIDVSKNKAVSRRYKKVCTEMSADYVVKNIKLFCH